MSYIGIQPKAGSYDKLDDISGSFNGVTVTFNLTVNAITTNAGTATNCIIALNGNLKTPDTDYSIDVNQITFATAPAGGVLFSGVVLGSVMPVGIAVPDDGTVTNSKLNAAFLLSGALGGTGVINTGKTLTLGGNLVTSGASALTLTTTGATNVTFPTTGTLAVTSAIIAATKGGTGQSTYAVGDLLQANTTTTLAKIAAVATGNVLISGGAGVASSWSKVALTTHVSGILPVANGGTGIAFFGVAGPTIARTYTFPNASATIARTDAANIFTGVQTMSSPAITTPAITGLATGSGVATAATASTLVARDGSGNFSAGTITAALTGTASGNLTPGTPAITLGTSAVAGVATTGVRTDATILAFDATSPAAISLTGVAAVGAAGVAARRDHVHAISGILPSANGGTGQSVYVIGDILAASTTTVLSKITAPVTGYVLRSVGAGILPVWAQRTKELNMFNKGVAPATTTVIDGVAIVEACVIPINCASSRGQSRVTATAAVTWDIIKSSGATPTLTTIGNVAFAIGACQATFTTSGGTTQSLAVGDMIYLRTTAASDATLNDIAISIFANVT